ncbi:uncharacterized protein SPSC_01178 [Sporisorium scitamineum]|uniref:Uncharacterized protein n=1 Tax=Sporisorium scitamineum TaxID=49012 RepID=A0A0F7SDG3_9BASI|nr:uncharacterized protein SPSC_01178 [Sporisorium scitamineum]CDW99884.1 hypothetical protein [Sporisorium scitamineum]
MAGPTIELFSTSILSNVKVRTRHERYTSVLAIKKISYVYHDLASDDDAKSRWRRKAKDPQLPGLLVNNEWVGSYDEFEEAVEFGELELFLGVSPSAAQTEPPAPHAAQSAVSSKDPSLYPTLPYAAEGAGRWKEPDADQFISTLNIKEDELTDADVDALLADIGKLPAAPASTSEKKYVPSKEATIKPLRLAKMGPTTSHQRMPSGSPSPASASGSAGSRGSPMARYSATQRSTKALAAEAAALTSNRKTSGALLREAVSQGKTLDDAMEESRMKHIVSQDNIDDLFASLGLSNVDIGDDEVDQFLEQGAIPQGLRLGGDRVHRPSSIADKARDEAVARDLAKKAKSKGHVSARGSLSGESAKVAALEPAALVGSAVDDKSADISSSSVSEQTSAQSSGVSTVTEATSEVSESKSVEVSKAQEPKPSLLDALVPTKDGDGSNDVSIAEPEPKETEKTQDTSVKPIVTAHSETATEQPKTEVSPPPTESTAASEAPEPDEAVTDAAQELTSESKTRASLDDTQGPTERIEDEDVRDKPTADDSMVSGQGTEEAQEAPTIASSSSKSLSSKDDDESETPVKEVQEKTALIPGEDKKTDSLTTTAAAAEEKMETPPIRADPTDVQDKEQASNGDESFDRSIIGVGQAQIDEDKTPTEETAKDPIAVQVSSPSPAPTVADSEAAAAAVAAAKEQADAEASFELELAQAAMIASRYEDHKSSAIPKTQEPNENSPIAAPSKDAGSATREETLGKAGRDAATGQNHKEPVSVRQVSSRRAIDVSRPIDPAAASSSQPVPPQSNNADLSTSPDTSAKKKKMGIRGFGLGREKDKDTKSKEAGSSENKPAAGGSRHERTISQILREADAVLQSDDYEGGGSDGEEEDPTMFGSSSNDTDAAGPTRALRST